jgi:thiamine biosynthesis lipoprotein
MPVMKRGLCILLAVCLLLAGCAMSAQPEQKQYSATFLTLFDTVTAIVGRSDSKDEFEAEAQEIHDALLEYHQLFDIYNDYEGINNLKTVNNQAGISPVSVDSRIIALLKDCRTYNVLTGGKVNVAMGSVLQLWHEARNDSVQDPVDAYLPEEEKLREAAMYTDLDCIEIDEEASTVFITDARVQLDVGAVAKGWAVQRVCEETPEGLLISVGGNVFATGTKDETGTPWVVGIQDPRDATKNLHTLYVTEGSLVTSGDYQRTYAVNGELYHHIIDPATLYPGTFWSSVTILCEDSGLADALSTALFLMDQEEGQKLLDQFDAKALWVDREGNLYYSPGFQDLIRT